MGCASSKVLGNEYAAEQKGSSYGSLARGISMPTQIIHHPECPESFHIVALTSSTYGILKVDPPKPAPEEAGKDTMAVKEVLNKLTTLESRGDTGPQSWLEVSNMLENLKPGLEAAPLANKPLKASKFEKAQKPSAQQLHSIDINEIMMDIDEDTGLLKPNASMARRVSLRKGGNSLPIRTLEELDKRTGGGKENITKNRPPVVSDFRALLKPIDGNVSSKPVEASWEGSPKGYRIDDQHKPVSKPVSSRICMPDHVVKENSELFDEDVLESYKSAFPTLFDDDDWNCLELQADAESKHDGHPTEAVEKAEIPTEVTENQVVTSVRQLEAGQHTVLKADKRFDAEGRVISELSLSTLESLASVAKASPLISYEELCPPGGKHVVVLYTTSLRGIRKTYEDCIRVRDIVQSHGVLIDERDVSMHLEYRNELRELMERLVTVPRLFINGRYIGGVEKVCKLQEEGQLACLFEGSTRAHCSQEGACEGCASARFVPCFQCNGRRKVLDDVRRVVRCTECNENGLVQCPICS